VSGAASVWALVPIRPPETAKTRLAPVFAAEERAELARHMAQDVLAALRAASTLAGIAVLAADARRTPLAAEPPCRILEDAHPGNLCASLGAAAAQLAADGAGTVVIVPADLPMLSGADIDQLLGMHPGGVSVVPAAHDGGTNALVLTPPDAIECLFGPDSARRHLDAARRLGLEARRLELPAFAHDIDTVDDVLWLCGQSRGGSAREYLLRSAICARLGAQARQRTA
jgi:2-phospho-L-lactate guanylyltransferase